MSSATTLRLKLNDFAKDIVPEPGLFEFLPMAIALLFSSGYLFLISIELWRPAIIMLVALLFMACRFPAAIAYWATATLHWALALTLLVIPDTLQPVMQDADKNIAVYFYTNCLCPYLIYQLLLGPRNLFLLNLSAVLVFMVLNIHLFGQWDELLPLFIMLLLLNRTGRYLLMLFIAFSLLLRYPFTRVSDQIDLLHYGLVISIILLIGFSKNHHRFWWMFAAVVLTVLFIVMYRG